MPNKGENISSGDDTFCTYEKEAITKTIEIKNTPANTSRPFSAPNFIISGITNEKTASIRKSETKTGMDASSENLPENKGGTKPSKKANTAIVKLNT